MNRDTIFNWIVTFLAWVMVYATIIYGYNLHPPFWTWVTLGAAVGLLKAVE